MIDPILSIHVKLDDSYEVKGSKRAINMIPFHGHADCSLFKGDILPGGVDTQYYPNGAQGMLSARYMLEGVDLCGQKCRLFIDNKAPTGAEPMVTTPEIVTDSRALGWLETAVLTGGIVGEEGGIRIEIREKACDFVREETYLDVNGRRIYAELYKPQLEQEKFPLVIASHGYNSCSEHMRADMALLAQRGIAVCCYDFCGGGRLSKSSGRTEEMSILTEQRDLMDVFEWARKLPFVDAQRVYLYGSSQGGFVSALTAPQLSDHIRGIFLQFPAFCIPDDWVAEKGKKEPATYDFMGMVIGRCYPDELPDEDVFDIAARYEGPVVIFHGDKDPVVRLSYAQHLVKAYKNAELFVYPEQGHGFAPQFTAAMMGKVAQTILQDI